MKRVRYTRNPLIDSQPIVNFRDMLQKTAARSADDKAVYLYSRNKKDYSLSYKDFYKNIRSLGTALYVEGLAGSATAIIGEADPAYMTAYYATVITGGTVVPLDKDISDEEIVNFIKLAKVKTVVYTASQNNRIGKLADELADVALFVPSFAEGEQTVTERTVAFEALLEKGEKAYQNGETFFDTVPQDMNKCCAIIFTSGTTGTSKGVMLSQGNLISNAMMSADVIDQLNAETTLLSVLPMHHTYEVTTGHLTAQYYGATIALNDSIKYVSKNIKKYKPTYLILVPLFVETVHKKMWDEIRKKGMEKKVRFAMKMSDLLMCFGIDLRKKLFAEIHESYGGRLGGIVSGGAKLNPQCIKDFRSIGIEVQEGYGITECSPLLAANPVNKNKVGSVGPAVMGVTVKIDKEKPEDPTGEILAKGPNVMLGYFNNKEATDAVFTEDGFFRTGDIGYLDKDGYIHITGRKKNIIILSNGKNIYPEELEAHLADHPHFAEYAVVGREHEGELTITAVIYPDYNLLAGKSKEEIEALLREELNEINRTLPQYKQMRGLEVRETEFEKTTSRKIKRHKI
jgi:long-chain acyl-CoA synthetase